MGKPNDNDNDNGFFEMSDDGDSRPQLMPIINVLHFTVLCVVVLFDLKISFYALETRVRNYSYALINGQVN